ncbi:hypothetical protein AGOR_G00079580 [Albula goreensis]|uniref:Ig-like domain-containing protein n=1 Tax=Albula goreensis TaxID=1534307 RepID=A0A8T3DML9_9TELE|nr:hypothetical protein AGOR_G00079580 [Albula goreensis]
MRIWFSLLNVAVMLSDHGGCYTINKLPCQARLEPGLQYRKISWYKVEEEVIGLVLKNLKTNDTILYQSANHSYQVDEDLALILPDSALRDCGKYRCTLWPPIGHQIREADCSYYPDGCTGPKEPVLLKAPPSRLSSSAQWDHVTYAMMGGGAALGILLLIVISVAGLKWKSRKGQPYKNLSM